VSSTLLTIRRILALAAKSRPDSQKLTVRRGGHAVRLEIFSQHDLRISFTSSLEREGAPL
jgi:hypothetical protein